jgi:hypothetical protein
MKKRFRIGELFCRLLLTRCCVDISDRVEIPTLSVTAI